MTRYAAKTKVSVKDSRYEIEDILTRYGADAFGYADEFLANIMLADGQTFGDWAKPQIKEMYLTGEMPPVLMLEGPGA